MSSRRGTTRRLDRPRKPCGAAADHTFEAASTCTREGAAEARERHNVEVRLTPDITRGASLEEAFEAVRYAVKYRECGIVGIGLGGEENLYPPEPFAPAFHAAKEDGLASVPHAGEVVGPSSVRGALEALEADRIRHGIRAVDDPGLVREIAGRRLVLDVCPISNLRTGAVRSLDEHPLPQLVAAGILVRGRDDPRDAVAPVASPRPNLPTTCPQRIFR
ncbi:MAG TPA: hypothetical protein VK496_06635 [Gaiellaceae bacterium]|nr:hypothetical protein [Gaiellaceae bacterium]